MNRKSGKTGIISDILIAEDSPTQAAQIKHLLEGYKYKVVITRNGKEALDWLSKNNTLLVITDIIMPLMNGYELCERIKSDDRLKNIPVILLTSLSNTDEVIAGLSCGADSFITKPYNIEFLLYIIEKILAGKEVILSKDDAIGIEINYGGKKRIIQAGPQKMVNLLLNIYQAAIFKNNELIQAQNELNLLNESLEELVTERTKELKKNEEKLLAFNAELEERILERTAEANAANKAKSEFLANMSHEIRTPMNAVLGYADLLGLLIEDKTKKGYIQSIKSSGRSLLMLINDILDLSKVEAGKLTLRLEFVNARFFFSEFERIFSLRLAEKGLKFILEVFPGIPAGIKIDDARLRQILLNLIGNAIKFTESGSIKLSVYPENPQVISNSTEKPQEVIDLLIAVTDTGIGISKEMQTEIFNPFVQGQGQSEKKYGGTGLGLAITSRLVLLMNGTIELDSELKKGSTFKIRIPQVCYLSDFEKGSEEIQFNPADIVFEKATILVVDDVEDNRKYLKDALKNTGLIIEEAGDGQEAFFKAKEIIPDLIITDIRMPVLDGFEFLKKVKSNDLLKHIPVIAYSASVMKDQKELIRSSEFAGLLMQPVLVTDLYLELMKNLKFKSVKALVSDQPKHEKTAYNEIIDFPGLINILNSELKDTWKTFEIMQPIGGIRDFGNQLEVLGKKHNSEIITEYGEELVHAADNFDIGAILKLIGKYPVTIAGLKDPTINSKK